MGFLRKNALAFTALAAMALPAAAQDLVKVGAFVPEQSVGVAKVIKPWMEAVSAETGDVRMQGFWGGTLGKSPFAQFDLVQNGVADVTWVLPGYTAGQFPELSLFELPFLFESAEEASVVGWKLHEQGLISGLDGVHLVGFFTTEPNGIYMAEPIESLDDISGKKLRSVGPVHANFLETFGAAPQTLSSGEMNEALNRGTIDGVIQSWSGLRTFKTLPLISQEYKVPVGVIPFLLLMNEDKWNSLTPAAQDAVMKHGGMAMAEMGAEAYLGAGEAIVADVSAEGRIGLDGPSGAEMDAYGERAQAVHQWWIDNTPNGQAVYDAAMAALAEHRGNS
ncbi:TRAP transporter substrate-binding protein [Pseudaestuariivita sp.]|uniref:TRAP transporter substrate-binding protein n=1 Tax=Pseudaestuariivita sp. TaxID=2211669 RepID=UPI0040583E12